MMFSWDAWRTGAETAQKENEPQSTEGFSLVFSVIDAISLSPKSLLKGFAAVKLS